MTATVRKKVFNYKQPVESVELDEEGSLNKDILPCNCENSELSYQYHGYIITRDLRLIKKQKLRKLFTKGPNFREPQPLNYSRYKKEVDRAITEFARSLRLKHELEIIAMNLWVNKVKEKVKNRIKFYEKSKQIHNTSPVLQHDKVRQDLGKMLFV